MKIQRTWLMLILALVWYKGEAQNIAPQKLQETLIKAIEKARPASVRIWGFDTLRKKQMSAQFSGVVIKDGYILTAAHVTAPGFTYKVTFSDGKECIAKALGKIILSEDKTRPDVALMKILTPGSWPFAETANSSQLKEYQPCLSIAYPESLNQPKPTVRFGYVLNPMVERGFIQSTCMMEPGDSGGPLFDSEGRVIGLHSAIETPETSNYEIPVNLYFKYWDALQKPETYYTLPPESKNPTVAATDAPVIPALKDMASYFGLNKKLAGSVVKINSITNAQASTITGTIIVTTDKKQSYIVSKSSMVGESPTVTYGKQALAAHVVARDRATDLVLLSVNQKLRGGLTLGDENPQVIEGKFLISPVPDTAAAAGMLSFNYFDLPKKASAGFMGATPQHESKPAKVYFVRPGSQAAKADVLRGDIITELNGSPVADAAEFSDKMNILWPGDTINISLKRGNENLNKTLLLSYPPDIRSSHPVDHFKGGKSIHRDGFKQVFLQDAIITADRIGGPVFDLDGKLYGINIARFSRANTVVMPVANVAAFVKQALNK